MCFFVKLFCLLLLTVQCSSQCQQKQGPAKQEFVQYEECPNTGDHEIKFSSVVSRYQRNCKERNICVSLNISLQFDLNEDYESKSTRYCKDSIGMWKYCWYSQHKKACAHPSFWMYIIQHQTNASKPCPLPKGNYSIPCNVELPPETQKWAKRSKDGHYIDFYGQYKNVNHYYRNGSLVACIISIENVYPIK